MNIVTDDSGILDFTPQTDWPGNHHSESVCAKPYSGSLSETLEDLILNAEIDTVLRKVCLNVLANFGLTAWAECRTEMKFWTKGIDAALRWEVVTNPINRQYPPICALSVTLGDENDSPTLHAAVVADISAWGAILIFQAVQSLIFRATECP